MSWIDISVLAVGESNTLAVGSRSPMGFTPLNSNRACPSQKLRKLKTALMTVGVFRGSTARVSEPKTATMLAVGAPATSAVLPGVMSANARGVTPLRGGDIVSISDNRSEVGRIT